MQLLGHAGLQRLFTIHQPTNTGVVGPDDDDYDDDDDDVDINDGYGGMGARRRQRLKRGKTKPPPVPSEAGRELMDSGSFGTSNRYQIHSRTKTRLARSLMNRELGIGRLNPVTINKLLSQVNMALR